MRGAPTRLVAATFLLDLPVDLALDPGLAIPPFGPTIYGRPRVGIYLLRKPDSETLDVEEKLSHFADFFAGVRFTLDPRVDWPSLSLSTTSAAVTILRPTRAKRFQATSRWMTLRFEEALVALDRVLSCIGFLSGVPDVGALRRSDVPPSVLVAIDDHVLEKSPRDVLLTEMQVHSFEEWRAAFSQRDEVFTTAIWLAERLQGEGAPIRLFIDYAQRASRDLLDGRPDQAVLSATIAVETLVSSALRQVWSVRSIPDHVIQRRLRGGFQNLLRDHLRPYLTSAGADQSVIEDWVDECYLLRNQVAHEGAMPSHDAASDAVAHTMRVGITVAEALRIDPATRALGESLPLRFQTPAEVGLARLSRIVKGV